MRLILYFHGQHGSRLDILESFASMHIVDTVKGAWDQSDAYLKINEPEYYSVMFFI